MRRSSKIAAAFGGFALFVLATLGFALGGTVGSPIGSHTVGGSVVARVLAGTGIAVTGSPSTPTISLSVTGGHQVLRISYLTSGTTLAKQAGATFAWARMCAGGGGSGSVGVAGAGTTFIAAGGSAGGYAEYSTSTIPATWNYTIGAAGVGTSSANGTAGGNTTLFDGVTTVTTFGGPGGAQDASGSATHRFVAGPAAPAISTGGTLNSSGDAGFAAESAIATSSFQSGRGGSSPFGRGGAPIVNVGGAGNVAVGFCAGGSGAGSTASSAAQPGANGTPGIIELWEMS